MDVEQNGFLKVFPDKVFPTYLVHSVSPRHVRGNYLDASPVPFHEIQKKTGIDPDEIRNAPVGTYFRLKPDPQSQSQLMI